MPVSQASPAREGFTAGVVDAAGATVAGAAAVGCG